MTDEQTRAAILRRVPLLRAVDDGRLDELARSAHVSTVLRGESLFLEGEEPARMFVVLSGRVQVFRTSEEGGEIVLAHIGPGQTIGELSVIDRLPRSASARALERSRVISVPADRLRGVLTDSPGVAMDVAEQLAVMVRRLTGTASDFVFLDLPHRLAKHLLGLLAEQGGGATVVLPTSQSGVAAQLGVTRQSLNQALRTLSEEDLIAVDGRTVRVLDAGALERF